jgi:hypothetical protein
VRIYLTRPGRTRPFALIEKALVAGAWSMRFRPALHGTYTFTARYLGYGPFGPVTSTRVRVRVR